MIMLWFEKNQVRKQYYLFIYIVSNKSVCVENKTGSLYIGQVVAEWIIIFFEFFYIFCFP